MRCPEVLPGKATLLRAWYWMRMGASSAASRSSTLFAGTAGPEPHVIMQSMGERSTPDKVVDFFYFSLLGNTREREAATHRRITCNKDKAPLPPQSREEGKEQKGKSQRRQLGGHKGYHTGGKTITSKN